MDEALNDLGVYIAAALPQDVIDTTVANGELVVHARMHTVVKLLTFLRDDSNCLFKVLLDITAVDRPEREERFEVVYILLSLSQNQRIKVKISSARMLPCQRRPKYSARPTGASARPGTCTGFIFPITPICVAS